MKIGINRIKQSISILNGGEFQLFCEQYLSINGYPFISSKGGVPGTTITKPGTPDHICISEDRRYILIEDTTQKGNGIKEKLLEDIDKCLFHPKHKLSVNSIEKLFFCYNQELNDESIVEECRRICDSKSIVFEFLSLELLANDLFNHPLKYSRLTESLLNLNISWYGILSIEEFVIQNQKVNTSFSMNSSFFGRKSEVEKAVTCIRNEESLIIYGNPGTGKTRLAIEVCKALKHECSTICINGYSIVSIKDLIEAIESLQSSQIIIFIDDANEFSQLDAIRDVVSCASKKIKLVVTVRNYAKLVVEDKLNSFITTNEIRLNSFSREETKEFLNTSFNIRNPQYIDAIFRLSKGNSRLIVLASKLAKEKQNLSSIADATSLYNVYYSSFLNDLGLSRDQMITLGLVAYENRLYLKELDFLEPIFTEISLSTNSFIMECRNLEKAELLEINKDVVYFLDQSFKCFIQKKVFVDDKTISLGLMIKKLFFVHPENTKRVIHSILTVFQNSDVSEFVSKEVQALADDSEIQENSGYLAFLSFFGPFFPMHVMKHVLKMMSKINSCSRDECEMMIRILESFADSDQIQDAVELLFQLLNERSELLDRISQVITTTFSFKYYSRSCGYCTQEAILKKLEGIITDATQVELKLIRSVIPEYLKTHFCYTEGGETAREIKVCQFELEFDEKLAELRVLAWSILFSLPDFDLEIEEILLNYGRESYQSVFDIKIGECDWVQIERYIQASFNAEKLGHSIIVEHLSKLIPSVICSDIVKPFLSSKSFLLYKSLEAIMDLKGFYDFEHFELPESFVDSICNYDTNDFQFLFKTINEIKSIKTLRQPTHLIPSLCRFIAKRDGVHLLEHVNYCINNGIAEEPFLICALYSILANRYSDDSLFSFICTIDNKYRNNWMWTYYASKNEKQITESTIDGFYDYLRSPDQNLTIIGFRSLINLENYRNYKPSFIYDCLSIIEKNYSKAPFVYSSYLEEFFIRDPEQVVGFFNNDFSLLFSCYCHIVCNKRGIEDYDGRLLSYVSSLNKSFLDHYLSFSIQNETKMQDPYGRLQSLWLTSSFIEFADTIYFFSKGLGAHYKAYSLFHQFFGNIHIEETKKEESRERVKVWFFHLLDEHLHDKEEMLYIVGLFEFIPLDIRPDCIVHFLSICDDIDYFNKIEVVPFGGSWTGSKIPMLSEKIDYLENLKQRISRPKYLKHRIIIDEEIEYFKRDIRNAEIEELMEEWS